MDFSWIATPYGIAAIGIVCVLAGFIANKGVYWDRDDKVLKIGSKHHPETLNRFNELTESVLWLKKSFEEFRKDNEETQICILKGTITNAELSKEARAEAYDEYKRRGKNSWVDAYFEREVKPLLMVGDKI